MRPQTLHILNCSMPAQQQNDTVNWRQSFIVTEFMSSGINNYCLDCRRRNQLHCLKALTKCHKHRMFSCAIMRSESLLTGRNNITYSTCSGSCFHVMTLTFDLMIFNICSALAVTWLNHIPNFRKTEKSAAEFIGIILPAGLSSDPLGELTALSQTQWLNLNFSCVLHSVLGALTHVVPLALIASPLKLWAIIASTTIPKFKDRSCDSGYAPLTWFCSGRQYSS